jgi:hypothetical protein
MALNDLLSPHFRLSEFMSKDGANTPDSVLDDLRRQAALLEVIRSAAGDRPISINSGYRSPSHNTAVGGATHSQHPLGTAADFNVQGMQPRAVSELVTGLIDQGKLPSGGLGVYDNWVHYDHRQDGNARWAEDGGPVPPRARVQMNVAGSLGQTPEVMGAASGAFEQTPQGQIPAESLAVFRPDIRDRGMGVTEALMRDIGNNVGSFNYPDQLAKRNATAQNLLDRYSKSDDMSAGDIPGAVLAAPVNIAKHLLSPLRRALGNREQLQTDAWSGDQGLDAIAAFSGNPELVDKYRETPGAGDWLKSLVTDSAERKAAAARGVISRLALSDAGADGQGKAYLMAAQTAGAKANAIQSLLGGYGDAAKTEYQRRLQEQYGRQADAGAYQNTMQGNEAAERTRWIGPSATAAIWKDTAGAEKLRHEARGEGIKADYGPAFGQAWIDSQYAGIGRDNAAAGASTALANKRDLDAEAVIQSGTDIGAQVGVLRQKGMLNDAQAAVLEKRGKLVDAQTAREYAEIDQGLQQALARIQLLGLQGDRATLAMQQAQEIAARRIALLDAKVLKTDAETGAIGARLGPEVEVLNARAAAAYAAIDREEQEATARIGLLNLKGEQAAKAQWEAGQTATRKRALIDAQTQMTATRSGAIAAKSGPEVEMLRTRIEALKQRMQDLGPKRVRDATAALKEAQLNGTDPKSQLAKEAAQRADNKADSDAVLRMQEALGKGLPPKTVDQLLGQQGLPYHAKNQQSWPGYILDNFPILGSFYNPAPDYAVVPNPDIVAVPKNNVGGANSGGSSSLSKVDANAVQSGITNPDFYENDAAGRAQLESYIQRKLISADAAAAIMTAKNWAQD